MAASMRVSASAPEKTVLSDIDFAHGRIDMRPSGKGNIGRNCMRFLPTTEALEDPTFSQHRK